MESKVEELKQGDLVIIIWEDIEDECSWRKVSEILENNPPTAKSVGWVLNIDKRCIRILPSIIGSDDTTEMGVQAGSSIIPLGAIVKVEKIRSDTFGRTIDPEPEMGISRPPNAHTDV